MTCAFGPHFIALTLFLLSPQAFCATSPIAIDHRLSATDLQKHFAVIAQAAEGKVGVTAELLETHEIQKNCLPVNPFPLIVADHRLIGSTGSIWGNE
jgi:hypothetical protein